MIGATAIANARINSSQTVRFAKGGVLAFEPSAAIDFYASYTSTSGAVNVSKEFAIRSARSQSGNALALGAGMLAVAAVGAVGAPAILLALGTGIVVQTAWVTFSGRREAAGNLVKGWFDQCGARCNGWSRSALPCGARPGSSRPSGEAGQPCGPYTLAVPFVAALAGGWRGCGFMYVFGVSRFGAVHGLCAPGVLALILLWPSASAGAGARVAGRAHRELRRRHPGATLAVLKAAAAVHARRAPCRPRRMPSGSVCAGRGWTSTCADAASPARRIRARDGGWTVLLGSPGLRCCCLPG